MVSESIVSVVHISVTVQVLELRVTCRPYDIVTVEFRIVRMGLGLFVALEKTCTLVSPQLTESHSLIVVHGIVRRKSVRLAGIAGNLAHIVPNGSLDVVAEHLSSHFIGISP